ncbi:MAG: hypothetical protein GWN84_02400 [Gammaproteobacteria bacterium]|nr:hypothetical protein [Gammaproteobacteria bacterium]NIR81997.1 hypothetical protein [Gammaproteobacteria bacterium]NIR89054.1 hypothetical protein [Gammaproteobacteria bacterium]NIU03104.1 hypothetical protein [Gammaproteobacteria bacterium]NIV50628.1 hypothetical protein [Gammaproteobacteria bacterium]
MKRIVIAALICVGTLAANAASAREIKVEITNLTNATWFTPLLVAAHGPDFHLFQVGTFASDNLQAMAEGGDISGLRDDVEVAGGTFAANPAGGNLAPGETAVATLEIRGRLNSRLSIVAMLLPTNDGFVGLDAIPLRGRGRTFTVYLNGYDAGTEANDEIITGGGAPGVPGIPADPGGNAGTGGTGVAEPDGNARVHIHRSILGDTDIAGGASDLDSRIHRWLNPVARVVVTGPHAGHDD